MQERINEKISLFIDDDLAGDQALPLLKAIGRDGELMDRLQRYRLISQVLKHDSCCLVDRNFTERVRESLGKEPYLLRPVRKKTGINWRKTGLAAAASLVLAVLWMVNRDATLESPYLVAGRLYAIREPVQADVMDVRFNNYLQAHDNSVYINNDAHFYPYARVAGYQE